MDDVCISVLNILTLRYIFPIKTGFDRRKTRFILITQYTIYLYVITNYMRKDKYLQKSTHKIDPKDVYRHIYKRNT